MILIYSVVTCHGGYQNRNMVDVTGHRGLYRNHILSQLSVSSEIDLKIGKISPLMKFFTPWDS